MADILHPPGLGKCGPVRPNRTAKGSSIQTPLPSKFVMIPQSSPHSFVVMTVRVSPFSRIMMLHI